MEPYLITMEDLPSQVRQKLDSLFSGSGIGFGQYIYCDDVLQKSYASW